MLAAFVKNTSDSKNYRVQLILLTGAKKNTPRQTQCMADREGFPPRRGTRAAPTAEPSSSLDTGWPPPGSGASAPGTPALIGCFSAWQRPQPGTRNPRAQDGPLDLTPREESRSSRLRMAAPHPHPANTGSAGPEPQNHRHGKQTLHGTRQPVGGL